MAIFLGGMIKEEHRGKYAAIVIRKDDHPDVKYETLIEIINSKKYISLTSIGSINPSIRNPFDRIYCGISLNIGETIRTCTSGKSREEIDWKSLDELVVIPYFIRNSSNKPERIVLEKSVSDGRYHVTKEE